ncbi:MAG: cell division protein FtsL [Ruminococcus sp.]|nr:cell division protein FtsL [Ruminococcus sp.]
MTGASSIYDNYYYYSDSYDGAGPDGEAPDGGTDSQNSPEDKPHIEVRRNEARRGSVMTIIMLSLLAFALLGSVVYTFDKRNTVYNKVAAMNEQLDLAEAENVRLQSELESKMSAKNVEDYAEKVLGMQKIDSSQIKYIKIRTDDVVNIPAQDEGVLGKVRAFFDRCVEYFRG